MKNELTRQDLARLFDRESENVLAMDWTPEQAQRLTRLRLVLNNRLTTTGGRAWTAGPKQGTVELAPKVLLFATEADAVDTIRHEIGHIIAGPGKGHGREWQAITRKIGGTANRTHRMATPCAKERSSWTLGCSCCGSDLVTVKRKSKPTRLVSRKVSSCCRATITLRRAF